MNYKHLRYFMTVAKTGSIIKAAEQLHVSPQTISGQLTLLEDFLGTTLFDRFGKRLTLNSQGKLALSYAEDIFALGAELQKALHGQGESHESVLTVGVVDIIPKILAKQILEQCFHLDSQVKLVAREGDFDVLLSELALNKLDVIFSDRALSPGLPIKAFSREIGSSGVSFYIANECPDDLTTHFPKSLDRYPFLTPGDNTAQKMNLIAWFEQQHISPRIIGEFDDSALLKFFGQAGYGIFCTSSIIEQHVINQYQLRVIGRTTDIQERFYAITAARKVNHPGVDKLIESSSTIFEGQ